MVNIQTPLGSRIQMSNESCWITCQPGFTPGSSAYRHTCLYRLKFPWVITCIEICTINFPNVQLGSECFNTHSQAWHTHRPVYFVFERARAPKLFLLGKWHPIRKLYLSNGKGTEAMITEHGGNRLCCLREVLGMHLKAVLLKSFKKFHVGLFGLNVQ